MNMQNVLRFTIKRTAASIFLIVALFGINLRAQNSPLWGNLKPGSYPVGFKVIYKYDYSRSWEPRNNLDEQLTPNINARPLRISVWYPAQKQSKFRKALYGDYVFYKTADKNFARANKMLEERDVSSLRFILKNSEPIFNELMATPMAAYLNASPSKGRFPLVVYSSGLNDISSSNVVLYEYLASHGYVVVTVPQLGTSSQSVNLGVNSIDLETQVRDLEFALGEMQILPNVDRNKIAVAGHSMGGVASLILQFRNANVDAVIGLDASYGVKSHVAKLTLSPYYQPEQMRIPFLDLRRPRAEDDLSGVDVFRYSDRYFLGFPEIFHGDFTSFPMIAMRLPTDIQDRTAEAASRGYEAVCRYVLNFLNAYLKQDAAGLKFISNQPEANGIPKGVMRYDFRKGLQAPPTEEEFIQIIEREGLQRAIEIFKRFKAQEPQQPIIREDILNILGYGLRGRGQTARAIDVFKLNIEAHPKSANAYDSLAETYLLIGDKKLASEYYKKVLEVLPTDSNASEELKNSLRQTAMQKLKELSQQ